MTARKSRVAGIYVESLMHADIEELWRVTQTPREHARWDLRFTEIENLPRRGEEEPQRFRYKTRLGFGLGISGEGESVGTHAADSGARTSALKFWSAEPASLIREGAGYWKYIPVKDGVRFLTRYDYRARFGMAGKIFDRLVFRPLIGWATAWSFDRLKLWLERGVTPEVSLERWLIHAIARTSLALIWIYQGLVPKLLRPDAGELEVFNRTVGVVWRKRLSLAPLGVLEILFGLALLILWRRRALFLVNVVALVILLAGASLAPEILVSPFNPVALTLAMAALSAAGALAGRDLPSAANTLRRAPDRDA